MTWAGQLCERSTELDALQSGLARCLAGNGQAVFVVGSCGIGKTALLEEARRLATPDFTVAIADADPLERYVPFEVLRRLFHRLAEQLSPSERQRLLSETTGQAPWNPTIPAGSPGGEFSVVGSAFRLTADLCDERPLALIIDDLHLADIASVQFLAHWLLPGIEHLKCCVIVALQEDGEAALHPHLGMAMTKSAVLRPSPLGLPSIKKILEEAAFGDPPSQPISTSLAEACQEATGGNPLYLRELLRTLLAQPGPLSTTAVADLAPVTDQTVASRVRLALEHLPRDYAHLAMSAAVLGQRAPLAEASRLADMPLDAAQRAAEELHRIDGLLAQAQAAPSPLRFAHPLMHDVVYNTLSIDEREVAHRRCASLLATDGVQPEKAAAHLLHTQPHDDPKELQLLLRSSDSARAQGAPDAARVYLRRCLAEPLSKEQRADALRTLGTLSLLVDIDAAVKDLIQALNVIADPQQRAEVALALGTSLLLQRRGQEALDVWQPALADMPEHDTDLRSLLQACVLSVAYYEPGSLDERGDILRQAAVLREMPTMQGGGALDCVVAGLDAVVGDPRAVPRALRAMHDPSSAKLAQLASGHPALALGWLVLISGDQQEALESMQRALEVSHRAGSLSGTAITLTCRAMAWFARGDLAAAEADTLQAVSTTEAASVALLRPVLGAVWSEIMMEQDRLDNAEQALTWAQAPQKDQTNGLTPYMLCSKTRLLRQSRRTEQALQAALTAGQSFAAAGGANPALVPWMSEAALCLHALGRRDEALDLAYEELRQARSWSAPRAWGRALHVLGLLQDSPASGLKYFEEAVSRLQSSPAHLEHAKALADYSVALQAVGQETKASQAITDAVKAAERCGASALIQRIHARQPGRS